ncbi:hypothetical protein [Synoicihabitans lomoniglobus]|uniref:Arc family DNA binding domain-containing protein n=1 Tax=Synoicihabitans lomoniglobus TaxID=2909285 RepID=A0AAF0CQN2_9BACT|nr:hypothetical protein [Opitutaceae bacterium LMO-M01]WED66248.1 hypothetical protein PXH66_05230 [Opitutaceae bacterium LMO-M01]
MRVDPKLWAEIQSWADQEMRSVNGQIEYLLREAVRKRRGRAADNDPTSTDESSNP